MKISVIIPTFNRRHRICSAVESVLSQNLGDVSLELLIVDDHSSDGSVEFLTQKYAADQRVQVLVNTRSKGPAGARNTGILAATGDLIALLDSDDRFLSAHLSAAIDAFEAWPDVSVIFGQASYEQDGKAVDYMGPNFALKVGKASVSEETPDLLVFGDDFFDHLLEQGCYFNLSTVVLRSEAARVLMNEALRIAEDFEFWVRLSRQWRFACLKKPQIVYLLHDQNISFEAVQEAGQHAPILLRAYDAMLEYEGISPLARRIIDRKKAEVLFDWAYRCSRTGQFGEALRLHGRSVRLGLRLKNSTAVMKLAFKRLFWSGAGRSSG